MLSGKNEMDKLTFKGLEEAFVKQEQAREIEKYNAFLSYFCSKIHNKEENNKTYICWPIPCWTDAFIFEYGHWTSQTTFEFDDWQWLSSHIIPALEREGFEVERKSYQRGWWIFKRTREYILITRKQPSNKKFKKRS